MDPNTGRLRALSVDEDNILAQMEKAQKTGMESKDLSEDLKGLERVPEELQQEALDQLADKKETYVDLNSDSGLARWAKKSRNAKAKKKIKRKMAKKSKRINRKK